MKLKLLSTLFFMVLSNTAYSNAPVTSQLSCLLEPSNYVKVSSPISGVVMETNKERGGRVKKGQKLLRLEDSIESASLEIARVKEGFANKKVTRNKELFEQGLLSGYEGDELLTTKLLAGLEVKEAEARLNQRTIKSPVNGVVVKRNVSVGEFVGSSPLYELATLDPLYAEVILRAESYGSIKTGMKAYVSIDGNSNDRHMGRIKIVDRVIDAASGTYGIRIEIKNPRNKLPAGMKCQLFLDALIIPELKSKKTKIISTK